MKQTDFKSALGKEDIINIIGPVVLCIAFAFAGYWLGTKLK